MDKKKTAIGAMMLALVVGAGWALGFFDTTDPQVAELQKLREETFGRMDQMSDEERRSQFQKFRQRVEGLSEDQRREFFESGREGFQQMMLQRMDQFFAMSPEEQTEKLDEMIDRMEEWRANREQGGGGGPGWGRGGAGRGDMSPAQRDQRSKQRLDRSTPEMRAKMDRFLDMMNERREERGLEPIDRGRGMFGGRR
ncbi:MAG: hypothetical protein IH831_03795 [Planctomycetes bacterium]|nr:hypothetical protein [Planctomycetota bacterium]